MLAASPSARSSRASDKLRAVYPFYDWWQKAFSITTVPTGNFYGCCTLHHISTRPNDLCDADTTARTRSLAETFHFLATVNYM